MLPNVNNVAIHAIAQNIPRADEKSGSRSAARKRSMIEDSILRHVSIRPLLYHLPRCSVNDILLLHAMHSRSKMGADMGETDIRIILSDARNKGWSDQALVQRAMDLTRLVNGASLKYLHTEERLFLSAMARLVQDPTERRFVQQLCKNVLNGKAETANEELRRLLDQHGGVPTFFSSMGRLRIKAAGMAPRGMQGAAIAEVKRVFRATFGELLLPAQPSKIYRRADAFLKDGLRLLLSPLSPDVFGNKSAERYAQCLRALIQKQKGVGIVVQTHRLCPTLSPASPEFGTRRLAESLIPIVHEAQQTTNCPVVIQPHCGDTLALVADAVKLVLDNQETRDADVWLELPAYLRTSMIVLRGLVEWAEARAKRGASPLKILLVKGDRWETERASSAYYGTSSQLCASKAETDISYTRLLNAAMDSPSAAIVPVIGTQDLVQLCYGVLRWIRSGRDNLPPLSLLYGFGNHVGRLFSHLGCPVHLLSNVATEEAEDRLFEQHLLDVLHELSRPGGFLTAGYAPDASETNWAGKSKPLMAANSPLETHGESTSPPTGDWQPGNMGSLLNRAEVNRFYAVAQAEKERTQAPIPLVVGGEQLQSPLICIHRSLTVPRLEDYRFTSADYAAVERAVELAGNPAHARIPDAEERRAALRRAAKELRRRHVEISALLARDAGFTLPDAEREVRDAVDALRYHSAEGEDINGLLDGTSPNPLGIVVVSTGSANPLTEAANSIAAAWMAGNSIIYKPIAYTTLLGKNFAELLKAAGVHLIFLPCIDNEIAQKLVTDPRVKAVLCTDTQETAYHYSSHAPRSSVFCSPLHGPSVYLGASCDWQNAVRELVSVGLFRSGQSPSCPHVILVHQELYESPDFRTAIEDAVSSYEAKPTWLEGADLGPLSTPLHEGERQLLTSLSASENCRVKPRGAEPGTQIWSAGLVDEVLHQPAVLQHGMRLPLLGLARVSGPKEAADIQRRLANGSRAVIYSRDKEEIAEWEREVACRGIAVNCAPYWRPGILPVPMWTTSLHAATGPLCGSTNATVALCNWTESARPSVRSARRHLNFDPKDVLPPSSGVEGAMRLSSAADSLSYWWENEFSVTKEFSAADGLSVVTFYSPVRQMLRVEKTMSDVDLAIYLMAAMQVRSQVELSLAAPRSWLTMFAEQYGVSVDVQNRDEFEAGFPALAAHAVLLRDPAADDQTVALAAACGLRMQTSPVLANGRIEMLRHVVEHVRVTRLSTEQEF